MQKIRAKMLENRLSFPDPSFVFITHTLFNTEWIKKISTCLKFPKTSNFFPTRADIFKGIFQVFFNTYSMKQPDLYYFETIKMTSQAWFKFCMENTSRRRVFSVNFDQACDVIFMV